MYYEAQYGGTPIGGSAWYASLNVVITLGSALAFAHFKMEPDEIPGLVPCENAERIADEQHWKYFRNACSCFVDLMFKDCNLMAVQAICGMVRSSLRPLDLILTFTFRL